MQLERLLIICTALSSCATPITSSPSRKVDVEPCMISYAEGGAECVSKTFPDGFFLTFKDMENYVCFSSWDIEEILRK